MEVEQSHIVGNDHSIDITVEKGEEVTVYDPLRNTTLSIPDAIELYEKLGRALRIEFISQVINRSRESR